MSDCIMTMGIGFLLGAVCGLMTLPIPAPPTLAGILGIVGVFLGYILTK